MNLMVYTLHSCYKGEIRLPGEDSNVTPSDATTHRLQDVMNNPMLMYNIAENPSRQILLRNVTIIMRGKEGIITLEKPLVFIDPNSIELVYNPGGNISTVKTFFRADYEKKQAESTKESMEIITINQRKVVGTVTGGVDLITHPRIDRKFFAVDNAQIEVFYPEHTVEDTNYVLVNRDYVESFRELVE